MNLLTTFLIVFFSIVLAVPGYVLRKIKLFPEGSANVLAILLLYVASPFLNISSILGKTFSVELLPNFAIVFVLAVIIQLTVYFIAKLCLKPVKDDETRRVSITTAFLGNVGFMGIPVLKALFPENDVVILYAVVFNVAFNAMSWTIAVYEITGDKSKMKLAKIILNPPVVASLIAIPFFVLNIKFPDRVMTAFAYLGDMTLPLSMLILGIRLAEVPIKTLFTSPSVYASVSIKLIVSPLVALVIMLLVRLVFPLDNTVIAALYAISAMPSASMALSFAERYGCGREAAAKALLLSVVCCIFTIPLLMLLLQVV